MVKKQTLCRTKWCRNEKAPGKNYCHKCRSRKFRENNPITAAYNTLKANAKRRGKEFTLTLEEFKLFCKETGYLQLKGRRAHAQSIDRIDHTKGYSYDNIQIMQYAQNSSKGFHEGNDCPF